MIRKHTIHLLREPYNIEQMDDPYIYLDVQRLKKYVISTIKPFTKMTTKRFYMIICPLLSDRMIL